ncbi:MAG: hypothetical protein IJS20_09050 [Bacteroidales bacterium]|nr:hypothetical protein [Bacteroidales bacterium]
MKKYYYALMICFFSLVCGCKTNEDKADDLILEYMQKTLYDIESYSKIETNVTVAKSTWYNDTLCRNLVSQLNIALDDFLKMSNEMNDAKEHMDIWGPPTSYSSSRSDQKYYEYKHKFEKCVTKAKVRFTICKVFVDKLKECTNQLDTSKVIGWEIMHRFRCKTQGGYSTIGNYRLVMDKDFSTIIFCDDLDSEEVKKKLEAYSMTKDNWEEFSKQIEKW